MRFAWLAVPAMIALAALNAHAESAAREQPAPDLYASAAAFISDPSNSARVSEARDLLRKCFDSGEGGDERSLSMLEAASDVPFAVLEELLRALPTGSESRTGRFVVPFKVAADGAESTCTLIVPSNYDPSRKWPVFVAMHGHAQLSESMIRWYGPWVDREGFMLAAPQAHTKYAGEGWASTEPERSNPVSALEEVKKLYNVDPDKVVIAGACMGGHGTWETAMLYGDRFCAAFPTIGGPRVFTFAYVENLLNVPMYTYVGLNDQPLLVWNIRKAVSLLKKAGAEVRCNEYPDKGHDVVYEEDGPFFEWLRGARRDNYARRIVWHANAPEHARAWWAEIADFQGKPFDPFVEKTVRVPPGRRPTEEQLRELYLDHIRRKTPGFEAEIRDGNRIWIKSRGLSRMVLYLSDRMLDLDSDVVIEVNGKKRFAGRVKRSVRFMVGHCAACRDTGRVYACRVEVDAR